MSEPRDQPTRLRREERWREGVLRLMARADGWVMCRRPGCIPFTMTERQWNELPLPTSIAELDDVT
jgi:hypothetical protein